MSKHTDVVNENIIQKNPVSIDELGEQSIEKISETDFSKTAEIESFMNEILTIIVHEDSREGSIPTVNPSVNGINQPIIRGAKSKVKRKYVEALARARIDTFTQRQADPNNRASLEMVPKSIIADPFSVIHDPNPNGRAWLESIMRQY